MTFLLSKVFWAIAAPGNLLLLILALGFVAAWFGRHRLSRWLIGGAALGFLVIATVPVGAWLLWSLESRFPPVDPLPEQVDGIIVLGGGLDPVISAAYGGRIAVNGNADRLTVLPGLLRRWPDARLVFTGGSGSVLDPEQREAPYVAQLLQEWGLDSGRMIFESDSRNTWENAVFSLSLAKPQPDERWLLITSAFHMPRAVGVFRQAGWQVIAFPVDFHQAPQDLIRPFPGLLDGLAALSTASREYYGLIAYRFMGRTDALFPGPRAAAQPNLSAE